MLVQGHGPADERRLTLMDTYGHQSEKNTDALAQNQRIVGNFEFPASL